MDTTFIIGGFVPLGSKVGDTCHVQYTIPIKITMLQKEILQASPEAREPFIDEALKRLIKSDPGAVKQYGHNRHFGIADPDDQSTKSFAVVFDRIARGELERLYLDLTDFGLKPKLSS